MAGPDDDAPILIRDAETGDEADWTRLWAGYTAFYKVAVSPAVTSRTWARILDPSTPLFMRVATSNDRVVGFAICLLHESTFKEHPVCYLEDLFVDTAARGKGAGKALLDDLVDMAKTHLWGRLYWHTDAGNATARKLYDQYTDADGHVRYQMSF